jgi:hypothetical protein
MALCILLHHQESIAPVPLPLYPLENDRDRLFLALANYTTRSGPSQSNNHSGWDRKKYWGSQRLYLNVFPSKKAQQRERQLLHERTGAKWLWKPVPELIAELNRHLRVWAIYFAFGFPSKAFRTMDWYLLNRLTQNLKRRSQRHFRLPEGVGSHSFLPQQGLISPRRTFSPVETRACLQRQFPEIRMREIRTSGSMRGRRVVLRHRAALLSSLPEVARFIARAARLEETKAASWRWRSV